MTISPENFREKMNILRRTYKSIDMRGVFAYAPQERIWRCAFLKILFTDHTLKELDEVHRGINKKLGQIDKVDFKVILEGQPIERFDRIIEDLDHMRVSIGGITAQSMGTEWQDIRRPEDYEITSGFGFVSEKEAEGYPYMVFFSRSRGLEDTIRNHCNVDLGKYGIEVEDLKSYLGISDIDNRIDLGVCFPILCKLLSLPINTIGVFQIHQVFVEEATVLAKLLRNNKLQEKYEEKVMQLIAGEKDLKVFEVPIFTEEKIDDRDVILVSITHKVFGLLAEINIKGYEIGRVPVEEIDVGIPNMKENLLQDNDGSGNRSAMTRKKIFVVHGHDETNLLRLEKIIRDEFRLDPIILQDEPHKGRTLIDKFEGEAELASYAIILMTPDDQIKARRSMHLQSRPNVIFELGWFYGRLRRDKVCILFKEGTQIHSDLDGIGRIQFKKDVNEKTSQLRKELVAAKIMSS